MILNYEYLYNTDFTENFLEKTYEYEKSYEIINTKNFYFNVNKKIKIAFIHSKYKDRKRWEQVINSFIKKVDELKLNVKIKEYLYNEKVDIRLAEIQTIKALYENYDYLVLNQNDERYENLIQQISMKREPKLIIWNGIKKFEKKKIIFPFIRISFDYYKINNYLRDYFLEKVQKGSNFAVVRTKEGEQGDFYTDYFIEEMEKRTYKMVDEYYIDYSYEKAYKAAKNIIEENKNLKFIYSNSEIASKGVLKAIQETGNEGKIYINVWGIYGDNEKLKGDVGVYSKIDEIGIMIAQSLEFDLYEKTYRIPPVFIAQVVYEKNEEFNIMGELLTDVTK